MIQVEDIQRMQREYRRGVWERRAVIVGLAAFWGWFLWRCLTEAVK